MTKKQIQYLNIIIALVFAAAILLTAWVTAGAYKDTITWILVTLWLIPFFYLSNYAKQRSEGEQLRCIKAKIKARWQ